MYADGMPDSKLLNEKLLQMLDNFEMISTGPATSIHAIAFTNGGTETDLEKHQVHISCGLCLHAMRLP